MQAERLCCIYTCFASTKVDVQFAFLYSTKVGAQFNCFQVTCLNLLASDFSLFCPLCFFFCKPGLITSDPFSDEKDVLLFFIKNFG
jgi:hypothetical protein